MTLQMGRKALLALTGILVLRAAPALAIPDLQLYVEGGTYDASTQTWVTNSNSFKLWVLGDVDNTKHGGAITPGIFDVHIAAAFLTGEVGTITLASTTTSLLGALGDPSTPVAPTVHAGVGADGTVPIMDDGSALPSHGIYGVGTSFKQYDIGDFTLTDSKIGDFSGALPFPLSFPDNGQINVYDVTVTGYSQVHFDAFNHIVARRSIMSTKAPFSHDAEGTPSVPEPASLLLLGFGIGGSALVGLRRRAKR